MPVCARCHQENRAEARFCDTCGAPLGESQPTDELGDRRVVTALFADLSGFTQLGEQLDPEELSDLVNESFAELVEEVERRGGWLEKQIGDALVAVFGAPVVHEDDPVRAVQAALAMRERMDAISARVEGKIGRSLALHIGINTGLVAKSRGPVGSGDGDMVVLGDTMNTAARFQQLAKSGQIVVGETTYAASQWAYEFRPLPPLSLKGKVEPVVAYECLGPREQPASARGLGDTGLVSPLCGRNEELAALTGAVQRVRERQGGIVAIVGDAGVGKSRLIDEVARATPTADVRWLEGRSLSFGETISYFPFVEIVSSDVGIVENDSEPEAWAKLEGRLRGLFRDELAEVLPYLAVLLAIEVPDEFAERVNYLDGEAMRHQIFRASRLYFERLATEQPTVLVFEDFHWADRSSEGLFEHLLPLVAEMPLLVACLTRADPDTPGMRLLDHATENHADRYSELRLSLLTPDDTAQLVGSLLGVEPTPKLMRIFRKSEGNPFYLEELLRSLIDLGAFEYDAATGHSRLAPNVDELAIPNTIQGLIMARVDRLDAEPKDVLRIGAVIGRNFQHRVLVSVAVTKRTLEQHLTHLETIDLIRRENDVAEPEYMFKHALTQEAVYESILVRRRRELHAQVAQVLEQLFRDRLDELSALLAHHYARAEQWDRAQEYLFKAGDRAGAMAADAETLTHYERALAAYARAFGDTWDAFERATLERKMAEAFFRRGENEQAVDHFERALRDLGASYPETSRGVRTAIVRQILRQMGHVFAGPLLVRSRRDPGREAPELARIYESLGWIHFMSDRERLMLDALLLINESEQRGYVPGIVGGRAGLVFGLCAVPLFGPARSYARKAVALADEAEHPNSAAFAYFALGFHTRRVGHLNECRAASSQAASTWRRTGELRRWAGAQGDVARIDLIQGNAAAAYRCGREVMQVGADAGDDQTAAWGHSVVAETLARIGHPDEAARWLSDSIAAYELLDDVGSLITARGFLGRVLLRDGDIARAIVLLEETETMIAEQKVRGFFCTEPCLALADAYITAAEQAAESEQGALAARARHACRAARKQAKLDRPGLPDAQRLTGRERWLSGQRRSARKWWDRSLTSAERMGAAYEVALTRVTIGRWTDNAIELERGESALASMQARLAEAKRRDRQGHLEAPGLRDAGPLVRG
jgi:class 3 adenylate cyclase/tetratricopeptide (TPR) repeat protein